MIIKHTLSWAKIGFQNSAVCKGMHLSKLGGIFGIFVPLNHQYFLFSYVHNKILHWECWLFQILLSIMISNIYATGCCSPSINIDLSLLKIISSSAAGCVHGSVCQPVKMTSQYHYWWETAHPIQHTIIHWKCPLAI